MRVGFFGGTFDPPHRAHAMAILWALQSGAIDSVLVVPMARHPFGKQPVATFEQRLEMCRLMLREFAPGLVEVSDIEGRRDEFSYTIDTIRDLKRLNPTNDYRLIVGSDIEGDLPRWREGAALVELAPPLVIPRTLHDEGYRSGALPLLSSTDVRARLETGGDVGDLLPAAVRDYIRSHGLYREGKAPSDDPQLNEQPTKANSSKETTAPAGLRPLGRLAQYMNFHQIHDHPPVILTMDHRAVLVAAWAARQEKLFGGKAPLLLRFDAHLDMGERPRAWENEVGQLTDLDAVHALANDQRHDDGGWVITAMQWGLAGDVVTMGVHDYHRFPGDSDAYTDHRGVRHELAANGSARELLSCNSKGKMMMSRMEDRPLWVDIDLDFATHRREDGSTVVWNDGDWSREFSPAICAWLQSLLSRASLVTVAAEPEFCGGLHQCGEIAAGLKKVMSKHGRCFDKL